MPPKPNLRIVSFGTNSSFGRCDLLIFAPDRWWRRTGNVPVGNYEKHYAQIELGQRIGWIECGNAALRTFRSDGRQWHRRVSSSHICLSIDRPNKPQPNCNPVRKTTHVSGGGIRGVRHNYRAGVQTRRPFSIRKNRETEKMYGGCYEEKGITT
jgi:hypothetical protein